MLELRQSLEVTRLITPKEPRAFRLKFLIGLIVTVLAVAFLGDAKLYRPQQVFGIDENIQIAEAQAWWKGRLDIPERKWDSALYQGKVYSHFPPAFSFLSALVTPFFGGVPHWFLLLFVVLPIPILAYLLCLRLADPVFWSTLLAIGLVCGTSALPVIDKVLRGAGPYFVNQSLALIGVLIFLIEYFGKQRLAAAGAGLIISVWSRQMTIAYLLPLFWMMLRSDCALTPAPLAGKERGATIVPNRLYGRIFGFAAIALFAAGVPMGLNWLKFGKPLDSGYMYIYEGRSDDVFVRDAKEHGIFSAQYIPRNLYYTNVGAWEPQRIKRGDQTEWHLAPQLWGTGIWWTSPFLIFVFFDLRAIWNDPRRRMLLMAAALAYIGLMVYHSTGYKQRGYNRYSLDYLPALFALAVPAAMASPWRKAILVLLVCWSVSYFGFVRHWPQIRMW